MKVIHNLYEHKFANITESQLAGYIADNDTTIFYKGEAVGEIINSHSFWLSSIFHANEIESNQIFRDTFILGAVEC